MTLTINGVDYRFEFTIEASLCEECVAKTTEFMYLSYEASTGEDLRNALSASMASLSSTALAMFYGGLLEHHGEEIRSKADAKKLVAEYFKENFDNPDANWYGLLNMMIDQMGKDGFFKLIGLEAMIAEMQTQTAEQATKKATRKSTTATKR